MPFRSRQRQLGLLAVFLLIISVGFFGPTHNTFALSEAWQFAQAPLATTILWIATIGNYITTALGQLILVIIEMLIVPILQYNGFSSSPTISLGWSLVRDVVNMFVVIVLLFIAISTILGTAKKPWQDALPRFLLAVILVNFSRTICGLLIDVSQVVMFTFVNAMLSVLAGNFASLLGLQDFGQYAAVAVDLGQKLSPLDAGEQLGGVYLQFALYAAMFAIMLLLALVFIWRIVVLWILVIMSPLTFFLGGIKDIFSFAAGPHGEWWKKFTAALTLGPMLTFFLWLAMAASSGSPITQNENFPSVTAPSAVTLVVFQTDKFMGVLLGLVLLVVGMQQAAGSANALGGIAGKLINEDMGKKIVGGAIRLPLQKGGGFVAKQADRRLGGLTGTTSFTAGIAGNAGRMLGDLGGKVPFAGGVLARTAANVTGAIQRPIEAQIAAENKAEKARIDSMTDDQYAVHVRAMAQGHTSAFALSGKQGITAMQVRALTDGDARKKLKKEMGVDAYERFMKVAVNLDDDAIKSAGGDMEKVAKARSQSVHLLDDKKRNSFMDTDKFDLRSMSEEAVATKAVRDRLKTKYMRTDNNGRDIYADEDLMKGALGESLKKAALGAGLAPVVYDFETAVEQIAKGVRSADEKPVQGLRGKDKDGNLIPYKHEAIAAGIAAGRVKLSNLKLADFDDVNGDELTMALLQTRTDPTRVGVEDPNDPRVKQAIEAEYLRRANKLLEANKTSDVPVLDVTQIIQVDISNLAAGANPEQIFDNEFDPGSLDRERVERVLERQPELTVKFSQLVGRDDRAGADARTAVLNATKANDLKLLSTRFAESVNDADKKAIAAQVDVIARAMDKYVPATAKFKVDKNFAKVLRKTTSIVGVNPPVINESNTGGGRDDDDGRGGATT